MNPTEAELDAMLGLGAGAAQPTPQPTVRAPQPEAPADAQLPWSTGVWNDLASVPSDIGSGTLNAMRGMGDILRMAKYASPLTHMLPDNTTETVADAVYGNIPAADSLMGYTQRVFNENKPESRIQQAVQTASEWAAPIGPMSKADLAIGAAAATGEQLGESLGSGTAGELTGGLGATLASLRSPRKVLAGANSSELTRQDRGLLGEYVGERAHDLPKALAKLEENVAAGNVGNMGDLTEDVGMMNIVKGLDAGTPEAVKRAGLEDARKAQAAQRLRAAFGSGDGARAQGAAKDQYLAQAARANSAAPNAPRSADVAAQRAALEGLAKSRAQLDKAQTATDASGTMYETSEDLARAQGRAKESLTEKLSAPAWKKYDDAPPLLTKDFVRGIRDSLSASGLKKLEINEILARPEMRGVDAANAQLIAPKDASILASRLKADANRRGIEGVDKRQLSKAAQAVDSAIARFGPASEYEAAKEATTRMKKILGGRDVSDVARTKDDKEIGRALMKGNEEGAVNADGLLGAVRDPEFKHPEILDKVEEYILARAANDGLDDKFLHKHGEMLDVWRKERPEFVEKLETTAAQKQAVDVAETDTTKLLQDAAKKQAQNLEQKRGRLTKAVGKSQLSNFAKAPKQTLDHALQAESPANFKALYNAMPEASKKDMIGLAGDQVTDMFRRGELKAGSKKYERIQQNLKAIGDGDIAKAFEGVDTFNKLGDKWKIASAKGEMPTDDFAAQDIYASVGALAALKALPMNVGLMGAGLARRLLKKKLKEVPKKEKDAYLAGIAERMSTDSDLLLDILKQGDQNKARSAIDKILSDPHGLRGPIGRAAAATTNEINEE